MNPMLQWDTKAGLFNFRINQFQETASGELKIDIPIVFNSDATDGTDPLLSFILDTVASKSNALTGLSLVDLSGGPSYVNLTLAFVKFAVHAGAGIDIVLVTKFEKAVIPALGPINLDTAKLATWNDAFLTIEYPDGSISNVGTQTRAIWVISDANGNLNGELTVMTLMGTAKAKFPADSPEFDPTKSGNLTVGYNYKPTGGVEHGASITVPNATFAFAYTTTNATLTTTTYTFKSN